MHGNPLLWLHFRLTGAWRNNGVIAAGYVIVVVVAAGAFYRMFPADRGAVSRGFLGFITVVQAVVLLFLTPSAIRRAVLRDFQTGMIESHRLSPMSGPRIVAGYMTGPPVQAAWFAGISLLLGTYFAVETAQSLSYPSATLALLPGWYALLGCTLCVALMLAAFVLLIALGTRGKTNVMGIAAAVAFFGGQFILPFIPGLALIAGVMSMGAIISAATGGGAAVARSTLGNMVSVSAAQLALAAVFGWAAARKVRAPERPAFGIGLGLLLTLIWAATLVGGVAAVSDSPWIVRSFRDGSANLAVAQLVASTAALFLVALLPLAGAAVELVQADRRRAFGIAGADVRRRIAPWMPAILGGLTMAALILMQRFLAEDILPHGDAAQRLDEVLAGRALRFAMLAALLLSFWTDFNLVYFVASRGLRLFRTMLVPLIVLKALPLVVDLFAAMIAEEAGRPGRFVDMYAAGFSPIGTLMLCFMPGGNPWPGLVGQALIAGAATWVGWKARKAVFANVGQLRRASARA